MRIGLLGHLLAVGLAMGVDAGRVHAQASAIPSAQGGAEAQGASPDSGKGRKLLEDMVTALGGDAWLNRQDWVVEGHAASFYKGRPHEGVAQFEEYYRMQPFGERVVYVTKLGVIFPTDHRDVAQVWTKDAGYEITYKGKTPLPVKDVEDYQRRRKHTLEVVVLDWLKQPGVLVTYEGTTMVDRHLAEQVSVLTTANDAVTIELDQTTHLPLSRMFKWRDPVYKDLNTEVDQYDDYHPIQGVMTALTITRLQNGDMTSQRFLTKYTYNTKLAEDLFDPDRPLLKKTK
jgi:hypothetical protein